MQEESEGERTWTKCLGPPGEIREELALNRSSLNCESGEGPCRQEIGTRCAGDRARVDL